MMWYEKYAAISRTHAVSQPEIYAKPKRIAPPLVLFTQFDDATFRQNFSASPIKRIKHDRFVRNVLIAIGNSGQSELLPHTQHFRHDPALNITETTHWTVHTARETHSMSILQKRSISLYGHRTSIALEPEFWSVLENMARATSCSLSSLIANIDTHRPPDHGLASSLRVTALRYIAQQRDFRLPPAHAKPVS